MFVNSGGIRRHGDGVLSEALSYCRALSGLGHDVIKLNSWEPIRVESLDLVHFFQGGYSKYLIECNKLIKKLVFSPMIDSNQSFWSYRLAVGVGSIAPQINTVPGILFSQARGSDVIICRSQHERDRVVRGLGIPSDKVKVILSGAVMPASNEPIDSREVQCKHNLPDRIVLHVSSYTQSRKNAVRLAQAVGPTGLPLVFAGTASPGSELDNLKAIASKFPNIKLLGFQSLSELQALYSLSHVFCLPSIHEGVGLVGLDAACYGANIVVTKHGGPPDYYGSLAEYVDPYSIGSIREAVLRAWHKPRQTDLSRHIITNLSWERAAIELVRVYQEIIQ